MDIMTGTQLRVARSAAGLSQTDLANLAVVSRLTVTRYEQATLLPDGVARALLSRVLLDYPGVRMDDEGTLHVAIGN